MDENAYSGRWIARVRGKIIAQGGSPEQARRAAMSRFKEEPEIVFMPTSTPLNFSPLISKVASILPLDQPLFLVGGVVRDLLLGRNTHDFDFVVAQGGITSAKRVANNLQGDFYILDPDRDIGRVILADPEQGRIVMDFSSFRGPDLDADLRGRDFTLNAIAIDPRMGHVFDPLGGGIDLREKHLRACSSSAFSDDPLRVLRGVRLAAQYGFHILPETRKEMRIATPGLSRVSPERIRDEFFRILEGPLVSSCLRALEMLGVLQVIIPDVVGLKGVDQPPPHVHDAWNHTLAVLSHLEILLEALSPGYDPDKVSDLFTGLMVIRIGRYRTQIESHIGPVPSSYRSTRELLFLAGLFHDIGKPITKKIDEEGQLRFWDHDRVGAEMASEWGRRLALSNDEVDRLGIIVRNHMRILFHANRVKNEGKHPSRRAIYRFFRDVGPAGVELSLLALADIRATYENTLTQETWMATLDVVRLFLENWFEKPTESISPPVLVNGNDLMDFLKIQPGPRVGELLEIIREAQATGDVLTRDDALTLVRNSIDDL